RHSIHGERTASVACNRAVKGPIRCDASCGHEMPKHVLQDAAVLEVIELVESVDPAEQRYALKPAVGRHDLGDQALARLEIAMQTADRDLLAAFQPKRLPRCPFLEHQRNDAHPDQVGAVDALE